MVLIRLEIAMRDAALMCGHFTRATRIYASVSTNFLPTVTRRIDLTTNPDEREATIAVLAEKVLPLGRHAATFTWVSGLALIGLAIWQWR